MHRYLLHLLAGLAAAHRPEQPEPDYPATFEEEMEEIEQRVLNEPKVTFGQYCGLKAEQFPPVERWAPGQLQEINEAFEQMMFSWWVTVDLPKDLPPGQRYHWLIRTLDERIHLMNMGFAGIQFCEEEPLECPFGWEYCTCRKVADDWEHNRQTSEKHEVVEALLLDIRAAIGRMPQTLEFQSALADFQSEQEGAVMVCKPLAEWLEIDLERFPKPGELTEIEQSALAEELLSLFNADDELMLAIRGVDEPARRYAASLGYYSLHVHHDGIGAWHFKPHSPEELKEALKGMISPLDWLDLEQPDPPGRCADDEDGLPF